MVEEDPKQDNDAKSEDENNNNTTDADDNANSNDALMEDAQVIHFSVASCLRINFSHVPNIFEHLV